METEGIQEEVVSSKVDENVVIGEYVSEEGGDMMVVGDDNTSVGEQVLGYLEVQPSQLQAVTEGGTIYLSSEDLDQHLILAQGEEGGEYIVVVGSEEEALAALASAEGGLKIQTLHEHEKEEGQEEGTTTIHLVKQDDDHMQNGIEEVVEEQVVLHSEKEDSTVAEEEVQHTMLEEGGMVEEVMHEEMSHGEEQLVTEVIQLDSEEMTNVQSSEVINIEHEMVHCEVSSEVHMETEDENLEKHEIQLECIDVEADSHVAIDIDSRSEVNVVANSQELAESTPSLVRDVVDSQLEGSKLEREYQVISDAISLGKVDEVGEVQCAVSETNIFQSSKNGNIMTQETIMISDESRDDSQDSRTADSGLSSVQVDLGSGKLGESIATYTVNQVNENSASATVILVEVEESSVNTEAVPDTVSTPESMQESPVVTPKELPHGLSQLVEAAMNVSNQASLNETIQNRTEITESVSMSETEIHVDAVGPAENVPKHNEQASELKKSVTYVTSIIAPKSMDTSTVNVAHKSTREATEKRVAKEPELEVIKEVSVLKPKLRSLLNKDDSPVRPAQSTVIYVTPKDTGSVKKTEIVLSQLPATTEEKKSFVTLPQLTSSPKPTSRQRSLLKTSVIETPSTGRSFTPQIQKAFQNIDLPLGSKSTDESAKKPVIMSQKSLISSKIQQAYGKPRPSETTSTNIVKSVCKPAIIRLTRADAPVRETLVMSKPGTDSSTPLEDKSKPKPVFVDTQTIGASSVIKERRSFQSPQGILVKKGNNTSPKSKEPVSQRKHIITIATASDESPKAIPTIPKLSPKESHIVTIKSSLIEDKVSSEVKRHLLEEGTTVKPASQKVQVKTITRLQETSKDSSQKSKGLQEKHSAIDIFEFSPDDQDLKSSPVHLEIRRKPTAESGILRRETPLPSDKAPHSSQSDSHSLDITPDSPTSGRGRSQSRQTRKSTSSTISEVMVMEKLLPLAEQGMLDKGQPARSSYEVGIDSNQLGAKTDVQVQESKSENTVKDNDEDSRALQTDRKTRSRTMKSRSIGKDSGEAKTESLQDIPIEVSVPEVSTDVQGNISNEQNVVEKVNEMEVNKVDAQPDVSMDRGTLKIKENESQIKDENDSTDDKESQNGVMTRRSQSKVTISKSKTKGKVDEDLSQSKSIVSEVEIVITKESVPEVDIAAIEGSVGVRTRRASPLVRSKILTSKQEAISESGNFSGMIDGKAVEGLSSVSSIKGTGKEDIQPPEVEKPKRRGSIDVDTVSSRIRTRRGSPMVVEKLKEDEPITETDKSESAAKTSSLMLQTTTTPRSKTKLQSEKRKSKGKIETESTTEASKDLSKDEPETSRFDATETVSTPAETRNTETPPVHLTRRNSRSLAKSSSPVTTTTTTTRSKKGLETTIETISVETVATNIEDTTSKCVIVSEKKPGESEVLSTKKLTDDDEEEPEILPLHIRIGLDRTYSKASPLTIAPDEEQEQGESLEIAFILDEEEQSASKGKSTALGDLTVEADLTVKDSDEAGPSTDLKEDKSSDQKTESRRVSLRQKAARGVSQETLIDAAKKVDSEDLKSDVTEALTVDKVTASGTETKLDSVVSDIEPTREEESTEADSQMSISKEEDPQPPLTSIKPKRNKRPSKTPEAPPEKRLRTRTSSQKKPDVQTMSKTESKDQPESEVMITGDTTSDKEADVHVSENKDSETPEINDSALDTSPLPVPELESTNGETTPKEKAVSEKKVQKRKGAGERTSNPPKAKRVSFGGRGLQKGIGADQLFDVMLKRTSKPLKSFSSFSSLGITKRKRGGLGSILSGTAKKRLLKSPGSQVVSKVRRASTGNLRGDDYSSDDEVSLNVFRTYSGGKAFKNLQQPKLSGKPLKDTSPKTKRDKKSRTPKSSPSVGSSSSKSQCQFHICCQGPSPPELRSPNTTYTCKECHYRTNRIENIIRHYKECTQMLNQETMRWEKVGDKTPTRFGQESQKQAGESSKSDSVRMNLAKRFTKDAGESDSRDGNEEVNVGESGSDDSDLPYVDLSWKTTFGFVENDIVWVDWKNDHWPALVRKIYPKQKKVSVCFIENQVPEKGIKVHARKLTTFDDATRNKMFLNKGGPSSSKVKAVQKAEDYLRKRFLGIKINPTQFFNDPNSCYLLGFESDEDDGHDVTPPSETCDLIPDPTDEDPAGPCQAEFPPSAPSSDELDRIKLQMNLQNRKLLDCIKEGNIESHLIAVFNGTTASERHKKFNSNVASVRNELKRSPWFGPLDSEEQRDEIIEYCMNLFKEKCDKQDYFDIVAYVFEVWIPEAVIQAMMNVYNIDMSEAEARFSRGSDWLPQDLFLHQEAEELCRDPGPLDPLSSKRQLVIEKLRAIGIQEELIQAVPPILRPATQGTS